MIRPSKLVLAKLPTPIQKLEGLSASLGKEIYVKRDDSTGMLLSGNKIRKLEFVLKDAVDKQADAVVTCGGIQSNHVRATVVAGRRLGMKPFAVLRGEEPDAFDGNTMIVSLVGSEITWVTPEEYSEIDRVYDDLGRELRDRGLTPYFIPEGASNALGTWGYLSMMEELQQQEKELGLQFDSIFSAVGSGGTQAGLILGKHLTNSLVQIVGINVFSKTRGLREQISTIANDAIKQFELPCQFNDNDVVLIDDYIGEGYAQTTDPEMEFIMKFSLDEGIILDHVYTGKTCIGMVDLIKKNPEQFGQKILFIHTGGLYGLFPERERVTRLLKNR